MLSFLTRPKRETALTEDPSSLLVWKHHQHKPSSPCKRQPFRRTTPGMAKPSDKFNDCCMPQSKDGARQNKESLKSMENKASHLLTQTASHMPPSSSGDSVQIDRVAKCSPQHTDKQTHKLRCIQRHPYIFTSVRIHCDHFCDAFPPPASVFHFSFHAFRVGCGNLPLRFNARLIALT